VLGQVFDRLGWTACVIGIGLSLLLSALLAVRLVIADSHRADAASAFPPAPAPSQSGITH
jgi:hypothetical protein